MGSSFQMRCFQYEELMPSTSRCSEFPTLLVQIKPTFTLRQAQRNVLETEIVKLHVKSLRLDFKSTTSVCKEWLET